MKSTIAVAMSGGVDSLMAAYLLKKQGHPVIGIHFLTGYETGLHRMPPNRQAAENRIRPVAEQIGIELSFLDVAQTFQAGVVDYFTHAYRTGRTPNPCLRCNPRIKFGTVLAHARSLGAACLATGHYARVDTDAAGIHHLRRGVDSTKDQSYFLGFMAQKQLAHARFPLGGMTKQAVRRLAEEKGLKPAAEKESQDICFIRRGSNGEFMAAQAGFYARPGIIEDIHGNRIGEHPGLHLFTVGQRRGINCPATEPYYVLRLDACANRLIVGSADSLRRAGCRVCGLNWITGPPDAPFNARVRLRYRHQPVAAMVTPLTDGGATIRFEDRQKAVATGQGAVFYRGDEVLGGGWICAEDDEG